MPMPQILSTKNANFEERFQALLGMKREEAPDVDDTVAAIIAEVRDGGDAALIALTEKHDRLTLTPETLAFSKDEIDAAIATVSDEDRGALELAAEPQTRC